MVALEVIGNKLKMLAEYRKELEEYNNISFNEYTNDWKIQRIIERSLHLAIECCLDIANNIISIEGFREPKDNRDLFTILVENFVISKELLDRLHKMAQFRNIIVHDYDRIDPEIIVRILKEDVKDIDKFGVCIADFLRKKGETS